MPVRLPVDPGELAAGELLLGGERLHYLRAVLRLSPGDELELFDGEGRRAAARVTRLTRREAVLTVEAPRPGLAAEPATLLTLLFGVPRGDGADEVVRAGTEVGVAAFLPLQTARTVARPPASRRERWARIAAQAARQCGRSRTPEVAVPTSLADALAGLPPEVALRLVAWEDEPARPLGATVPAARPGAVALLVGPEGGLEAAEVAAARAAGFETVTLGPRLLRARTAAVVAPALLLHRLGDLG